MVTLDYPKNGWEIVEDRLREDKKLVWKYNKPGIYCIKVRGKIVYIGKSLNMLTRIAQHMFEINRDNQKSHKYQVLRQLKNMGENIQFDVLKKCYGRTTTEMYDALRRCGSLVHKRTQARTQLSVAAYRKLREL